MIDDNFCIINKRTPGEQEVEEKEFGVNQVFGVDVFVSTGDGTPKIVRFFVGFFIDQSI